MPSCLDLHTPLKYTHHSVYFRGAAMQSIHKKTAPPLAVSSRVFMNGNSQAVRIPQQFRLDTDQVEISRNPDGSLRIQPIAATQSRGDALLQVLSRFDASFVQALESDRRDQPATQERDGL